MTILYNHHAVSHLHAVFIEPFLHSSIHNSCAPQGHRSQYGYFGFGRSRFWPTYCIIKPKWTLCMNESILSKKGSYLLFLSCFEATLAFRNMTCSQDMFRFKPPGIEKEMKELTRMARYSIQWNQKSVGCKFWDVFHFETLWVVNTTFQGFILTVNIKQDW